MSGARRKGVGASSALQQLQQARSERRLLDDLHGRLNRDKLLLLQELELERSKVVFDLDMKIHRKSLSLKELEIPRKRPKKKVEIYDAHRHIKPKDDGTDQSPKAVLNRQLDEVITPGTDITRLQKFVSFSNNPVY